MKTRVIGVELQTETLVKGFRTIEESLDYIKQVEDIDGMTVVVQIEEVGIIHSASLDDLDSWEEEFSAEEFVAMSWYGL